MRRRTHKHSPDQKGPRFRKTVAAIQAIYERMDQTLTAEEKDIGSRRYWAQFQAYQAMISKGYPEDFAHFATKTRFLQFAKETGLDLKTLPLPNPETTAERAAFVHYLLTDEFGEPESPEQIIREAEKLKNENQ